MTLDSSALVSFALAAAALLGSPGPGIAALIAVGRREGFRGALSFYGGLQLGLALVAGLCVVGLSSVLNAAPVVTGALALGAGAYLVYLAWKVAAAPVGAASDLRPPAFRPTALGGAALGLTNPKAYVAFVSLMGAHALAPRQPLADAVVKWAVCVAIILTVDLAWLWFGGVLKTARLPPRAERALNLAMGAAILATTLAALA